MLVQLFPRMHRRYSSLRLLGPMLGDFARWLQERGYPRIAVRRHIRASGRLEQRWHRRGIRSREVIGRADFAVCAQGHSQDDPDLAAVAHVLETYFEEHGLLPGEPGATIPDAIAGYRRHLTTLRGLAASTISDHLPTASELLRFVADQRPAMSLQQLTATALEGLVQQIAARVSRATLQHVVHTCAVSFDGWRYTDTRRKDWTAKSTRPGCTGRSNYRAPCDGRRFARYFRALTARPLLAAAMTPCCC